jgi:16S rRNA (guanine1207-N2)-methyltransferase
VLSLHQAFLINIPLTMFDREVPKIEHYYSQKPGSISKEQTFQFVLRGKTFTFVTDRGVFSKERIDFGSVLLIETMDIQDGMNVLDVGCGYGPIGIAAATLTPSGRVKMIDINERAVSLARKNLEKNQITNGEVAVSDLFSSIGDEERFDVILTNPPIRAGKKIVHDIFVQAYHHLEKGGSLWVVIQKKQGAPSAMEKLEELFGRIEVAAKKKGYYILHAQKQ